jgi:phosphatidylglycerophosphate synthase
LFAKLKTSVLRKKTRKLVSLISKPFVYLGFTPNMVSFLAIVTVVAFFPFLQKGYFYLAALMILLNGVLDLVDGAVARATRTSSIFGKFLDRTLDKVSDAAILAAFIVYGLVSLELGLYTLVAMFLATNVSANIEGVLKFKISDAVSMRFLRIIILVVLTAMQEFRTMFIILAIISTYSLVYRFAEAGSMYFRKKK